MPKLSFDFKKVSNDPRFRAFARRVGNDGNAWLALLRFWDLAIEHWGNERSLVPIEQFELDPDFQLLVACKLAEVRQGGVYAKGGEEAFEWYAERREASAKGGKASAKARLTKLGSAQPLPKQTRSKPEANPKQHFDVPEANPNPSISVSTSISVLQTPPVVPLARAEARALREQKLDLAAFAETAAQEAFIVAESVDEPYSEHSVSARAHLAAPTLAIVLSAYGTADGFPKLVRAIKAHRKTRSPDAKFIDSLRSMFVAQVLAKPELRPDPLAHLAPSRPLTEPENSHLEASS